MKISSIAALLLIGTTVMMAGTEGESNTYYGLDAGNAGGGSANSFFGYRAGYNNIGSFNIFSGYASGTRNTTGRCNIFIGHASGNMNTTGDDNTFIGYHGGINNTTGYGNTFSGYQSGYANTEGWYNTFSGYQSGYKNTIGDSNTFIGDQSGYMNTNGAYNTFIGKSAGYNNSGSGNVFLGALAGAHETGNNRLYIDNSITTTPLIYGEFDNDLVRINGSFETTDTITATWAGSNTVDDGLTSLVALSANNSESGDISDVGFTLNNDREDFTWAFRTMESAQGFAATKLNTGGPEFRVDNPTSDYHNAKVSMGGVVVFENGQLQTPSSRALKTNIKPLDTQAALKAFHDLQPVSYAYKAHKDEPVVGFIAEDIPELVATKTRTGIDSTEILAVLTKVVQEQDKALTETRAELKNAQEKIAKLELMQKRLAKVESLLTNLALDTSKTTKEKISLK